MLGSLGEGLQGGYLLFCPPVSDINQTGVLEGWIFTPKYAKLHWSLIVILCIDFLQFTLV